MIEGLQLAPGAHPVTSLANLLTRLEPEFGDLRKLSAVGILMTAFAGAIRVVVLPVGVRGRCLFFVAILAGHRGMCSLQRKGGRLMLGEREGGRMKALHLVAFLASVVMGRPRKLAAVRVFVTILASLGRRVVVRVEAGGNVALGAGQPLVFSRQRIGGSLMASLGKGCRFPAFLRMARGAFAMIYTARELAFVLILMAVHALFMRDGGFEIRTFVALLAGQPVVLSVQGEFRLAVIEVAVRDLHAMPAVRVVA